MDGLPLEIPRLSLKIQRLPLKIQRLPLKIQRLPLEISVLLAPIVIKLVEPVHPPRLMIYQADDLVGEPFRPFFKDDPVLPVLFLSGRKARLAFNNEFDRSIQLVRSHESSGGRTQRADSIYCKVLRREIPFCSLDVQQ